MAITNPQAWVRDDANWSKSPLTVSIGAPFEDYAAAIAYRASDESFNANGGLNATTHPAIQAILNSTTGDGGAKPIYFSRRKCRDTSLGGNDAINPLPAFDEWDDPIHPFTTTNYGNSGLGDTYNEVYDDQQQIMYMCAGHPVYNNLNDFYKNAVIPDMADIMNKGPESTMAQIGRLLGEGVATFVTLPVVPILIVMKFLNNIDNYKMTKYYDFGPQMALYYRMVNSILIQFAVNMGLTNDANVVGKNPYNQRTAGSRLNDLTNKGLNSAVESEFGDESIGIPDIFVRSSWDIYKIIAKKNMYEAGDTPGLTSTDQALAELIGTAKKTNTNTGELSPWRRFINQFTGTLYDAQLFVGIRINRTTDTTETLSNTTAPSEIQNTINSKIQGARNMRFSAAGGNLDGGFISGLIEGIGSVVRGAADTVSIEGLAAAATGAGIIDIPEVYQSSNFSRSYSFSTECRAPYGDPISILQSEYVLLACMLGFAAPRGVGGSAYTQPFLVRAYSKGVLSIPMGIIDSLTISRGGDTHGWSYNRLPTVLNLSWTIKDLSPSMYQTMASDGFFGAELEWINIFAAGTPFQEYIMTLSGMGLAERISFYANMKRRAKLLLEAFTSTKLNPEFWGIEVGATTPMRMVSMVIPGTRIPTN